MILHVQTAKFEILINTNNCWDKLRLNNILNNGQTPIRGSGGRSPPEARGYFNAKGENFNTRKNFLEVWWGGYIPPIPPWIRPWSRLTRNYNENEGLFVGRKSKHLLITSFPI